MDALHALNVFSLLPFFLVGLLGSVHCIGMCGGIVGAFSLTAPARKLIPLKIAVVAATPAAAGMSPKSAARSGATSTVPNGASAATAPVKNRALVSALAYNAGRIGSYAAAGAIAGGVAQGARTLTDIAGVQLIAYSLANLLLIALGLYLTGAWRGLNALESLGGALWRRVQPLTRRLLPLDSIGKTVAMGALWGWLPCGMVYSVLLTAMLSGSAFGGAAIMAAFGLGTLPMLLSMGLFGARLKAAMQRRAVRIACGLIILGFGVLGLLRAAHGLPASWLDAICISALHGIAP